MTDKKQYTLEELKEKLIQLTGQYIEFGDRNNQDVANLLQNIKVVKETIITVECSQNIDGSIFEEIKIKGSLYIDKDGNKHDCKISILDLLHGRG